MTVDTILSTGTIEDTTGNTVPLHSHTSETQGRFLQSFIESDHISTALEIGLAYGVSALFTCGALSKKKNPRFISIDLEQHSEPWNGTGRANVERAGFGEFAEFHDGDARTILPALAASGERIDFAYLDACKIFDVVLVNASYVIAMLRVGGFVAFDDCGYPGIRRVVRYLAKWPHLKIVGRHGEWRRGVKRKLLSGVARMVPMGNRIFRDDLLKTDAEMGVDANCVVFQKVGEDTRRWDWSETP